MLNPTAIVTGLVVLAVAAVLVLWKGERLARLVMAWALVCWIGAAVGQFATGQVVIPIIVSDLAFAVVLLVLTLRHHRLWLYGLFAIEASRLLLHGMVFEQQISPSAAYRLTNNVLSTLGLVLLVAVALWPRRAKAAA